MKTKIIHTHRNSCVELIIDEPVPGAERRVLAAMTLFEGTGAWMMTDVRLHQHMKVSRHSGSLRASDIHSFYEPKDEEQAKYLRSRLHTYSENEEGFHWSTYEGLILGTPREGDWISDKNHIGFFTKQEGLEKLKEIQAFWDDFEGDPDSVKIDNPLRQPSESAIMGELVLIDMGINPRAERPKLKP